MTTSDTTSGITSDNEWQQVATNDEWYNEWQRVVQRVETGDNEWQRMTISGCFDQFPFCGEEPTNRHPKENPLHLEVELEEDILN